MKEAIQEPRQDTEALNDKAEAAERDVNHRE
jgi:hypothetical protein